MTSNPTSEGLVELILWWRDQSTVAQPDKPGTPWDVLTRAASRIEDLEAQLEGAKEALREIGLIAEHNSFVSSAVEPSERVMVVLGQAFVSIQDHARSALAASTLYGLEKINVSSVAGAEVAASTGVKTDSSEGH